VCGFGGARLPRCRWILAAPGTSPATLGATPYGCRAVGPRVHQKVESPQVRPHFTEVVIQGSAARRVSRPWLRWIGKISSLENRFRSCGSLAPPRIQKPPDHRLIDPVSSVPMKLSVGNRALLYRRRSGVVPSEIRLWPVPCGRAWPMHRRNSSDE
jgi:hypothetical protein